MSESRAEIPRPDDDSDAERDDIVLVDDEPVIAELVRRLLRGSGRQLIAFDDPLRALAHLERRDPRVLLVDTRMPLLDGPELLVRLVECGRLRETHVILCSAARRNTAGEPPAALPRLEWLPKDELLDRRTLLERLGGSRPDGPSPAAAPASGRIRRQPSSAADSSGNASNKSATSP